MRTEESVTVFTFGWEEKQMCIKNNQAMLCKTLVLY